MSGGRVVAITGASGFIGSRLAAGLRDQGWTVRALVRQVPEAPLPGIDYAAWDLANPGLDTLVGANRLVHAAAVPSDRPGAREANVAGSRRLRDEARLAGVEGSVFLSSMSARPDTRSEYGRDKVAIAALFDGPADLIVRPGLVLGNGGLFGRLSQFVASHRAVPLVGGSQRFQTVHVDDLVTAIGRALDLSLRDTLTVAERTPVGFGELLRELARAIGRNPLFVPVPYPPVAAALGLGARLGIRLPVSGDNLVGLRELQTADVAADIVRVGFEPRDYRASLRAIAEEVRNGPA